MIVVKLMGGLGNQMFQYAFARNLAIKNKTSLKADLDFLLDRAPRENFVFREYDLDIFQLDLKRASDTEIGQFSSQSPSFWQKVKRKLLSESKEIVKESHFYFDPIHFSVNKDIYLEGYWQSEKYFKENEAVIRKDFSFSLSLSKEESLLQKEISSHNAVCINFRRTDFVDLKNSSDTHGVTDLEYYENAIGLIVQKIKKPHFYVFSDDIEWCRENFKVEYPITYVGHEYKGYKFSSYLQLMSQCKHFIIPNSTFAWWAAWLCENHSKIVVTPDKWFKDSELQKQTKDIIPEDWLKL